jgi:hypothetical protein
MPAFAGTAVWIGDIIVGFWNRDPIQARGDDEHGQRCLCRVLSGGVHVL